MQTYHENEPYNETQFTNVINHLRKGNRDEWVTWTGWVNGKRVRIKFFNLWTQILEVDGIKLFTKEHKSVCSWVDELREATINK